MAHELLETVSHLILALCWQYGDILGLKNFTRKTVTCSVIGRAVGSIGGKNVYQCNTSNLIKHLRSHHMKRQKLIKSNRKMDERQQQTLKFAFQI